MPYVHWIDELNDAKACGLTGVILGFNTSDRVFPAGVDSSPSSLKYFLASNYHAAGYHVGHYSLSTGFSELIPPGSEQRPSAALERLLGSQNTLHVLQQLGTQLRDPESRLVLILEYAGHVVPLISQGSAAGMPPEQLSQLELLHAWSLDDDIRSSGNFMILINHENALNSLVEHEGGFRSIEIGLPDEDSRYRFTEFLSAIAGEDESPIGILSQGFLVDEFARATNGLRLIDIEELFRQSGARDQAIAREDVRAKKKQTINALCSGLLEVAEPSGGFEAVAGSHHAKSYFNSIRPLWGQGHDSLPQAVLLSGVPGTGKSFLIKAIAKEFDCPCLIMRGVREMWVGQSERNLDRVLQVVEDLAPCILWTDEIDQTVGGERSSGPSGDSGTNNRMLGRLLEFFGDSRIRGRILWVATTNRPDHLDVAIKDRFSIKIPFLHPNREEKEELLPILASQVDRHFEESVDCAALAAQPELEILTIRAMQEVIVWAGMLSDLESGEAGSAIRERHMNAAIEDYKPTFDFLEHELIALVSLQMTSFSSLLPWREVSKPHEPERAEWPRYLDSIVHRDTGQIDMGRLETRTRELEQLRMTQRR